MCPEGTNRKNLEAQQETERGRKGEVERAKKDEKQVGSHTSLPPSVPPSFFLSEHQT